MIKLTRTVVAMLAAVIVLNACNKSDDAAVKKMEEEVFAVHDEVMPRMDDLLKLKKQIQQQLNATDSSAATGSTATSLRTEEERDQARRLVRNLIVADSLMMDWMHNYNGDTLAKLPADEALRYLSAQKEQVTDVKTKFTTSIEQARQFMAKK